MRCDAKDVIDVQFDPRSSSRRVVKKKEIAYRQPKKNEAVQSICMAVLVRE